MKRQRRPADDEGQTQLKALGKERLVVELRLALARADDIAREIQRRQGVGPGKTANPRGSDPRYLLYGSPEWKKANGLA